jgi:adenylyltransferase/sulfurtransferase
MSDANLPELSTAERERYSRHLTLPEVGMNGQRRLKAGRVLVVGCGGLGSPVSLYLAAAGVGRLGLVDFDRVDKSNLQRQVLFRGTDVGRPKVQVAYEQLRALNGDIEVVKHEERLSAANVGRLLADYDVVVDGTDSLAVRYLINDACVLAGKTFVYAAIYRFDGQLAVFGAPGPCYRCLFPDPPPPESVPNCAEGGVLGVLPGIIGSLQAAEVLKVLLGIGATLRGKLMQLDALTMEWTKLNLRRDPGCPVCGASPKIRSVADTEASCAAPAKAAAASQATPGGGVATIQEIGAKDLAAKLGGTAKPLLLDVRGEDERAICTIAGSVHIPLDELVYRHEELDRDRDIVAYCKSGNRSRRAVAMLMSSGFARVASLSGGILGWIEDVDPSQAKY